MAQFQPKSSDIIDCIDIFEDIKAAQWLVQSIKDAMACHDDGKDLLDHVGYLIDCYSDNIEKLVTKFDQAFEKVKANRDVDQEWKDFRNNTND